MVRRGATDAELGERRGSYPIASAVGAVMQTLRRLAVLFCLIALTVLIINRPSNALFKGTIIVAVILGLIGLRIAWGWASARFGARLCHLHTGGLAVTGMFGQVKHSVPWGSITVIRHMSNMSPLLTFHRYEVVRQGAKTLPILVLQAKPEFVPALKRASEQGGLREQG